MNSALDNSVKCYESICKIPEVIDGKLFETGNQAVINVRQRNLPFGDFENYQLTLDFKTWNCESIVGLPVSTGFQKSYFAPSGDKSISIFTSPTEAKSQMLMVSLSFN